MMSSNNWICPNCGIENESKFCTKCGICKPEYATKSTTWICGVCGQENQGKFCVKCGNGASNYQGMPIKAQKSKVQKSICNKESKINYLLIGLVALVALGGGWYYVNIYNSISPNSSAKIDNKIEMDTDAESEFVLADKDLGLGKVNIDDTIDAVHQKLGQETKVESRDNGRSSYVFDDINVIINNGIVSAIESNSNKFATIKGIHQDSSLSDVLSNYGENYLKSSYDGLELYEYDYPGQSGMDCRIRFAINSSQNVEYISIRKVPRNSGARVEYEVNKAVENDAKKVLFDFHNYITQHRLRDAYNCLSSSLQARMTYDGWAPGFKNTVSSNVSNVEVESIADDKVILNYNLTAVDNPGGKNYFVGKVTVIRTVNGWKIDTIENHK